MMPVRVSHGHPHNRPRGRARSQLKQAAAANRHMAASAPHAPGALLAAACQQLVMFIDYERMRNAYELGPADPVTTRTGVPIAERMWEAFTREVARGGGQGDLEKEKAAPGRG